MKNFSLFLLSGLSLLLTTQEECNNVNTYDTSKLSKATREIQNNIDFLRSAKDSILVNDCIHEGDYDALLLEEKQAFELIKSWVTDSLFHKLPQKYQRKIKHKDFLALEPGTKVVKDAKISLPAGVDTYFLKGIQEVEAKVFSLQEDSKIFAKRGKICLRKFDKCAEIIKNTFSRERVKEIKEALRFYLMEDQELFKNKEDIARYTNRAESIERDNGNYSSKFFIDFQLALVYYINHRIQKREDSIYCNKSHNRWNSVERKYVSIQWDDLKNRNAIISSDCEVEYLYEESKKWKLGFVIDSNWVSIQKTRTNHCASHKRGCTHPMALNYNPEAIVPDGSCVGCKDSLAINYVPDARYHAPCIYQVCGDPCYKESNAAQLYPKYRPNEDSLVVDQSRCKTDICGCTNPMCREEFEPTAEIDDGSCKCGCLDSTAVNFARRDSPFHAKEKYYNPNIVVNEQSLCHWRGCTDPCAINYDPKAKENDGSCICVAASKAELQGYKRLLEGELYRQTGNADQREKKFKNKFRNADPDVKEVARAFNFRQQDHDLNIEGRVSTAINSEGTQEGIPLGIYYYKPINTVIDSLMDFLDEESGDLLQSQLTGKIVGEADGHPIRYPGILFLNRGQSYPKEPFRAFYNNEGTSLVEIRNDSIFPNKYMNLSDSDEIRDNIQLAFARAILIKQRIITRLGKEKVNSSSIRIGAKHNLQKGGRFRRISIVLQIKGFFLKNGKTDEEIQQLVSALDRAIDFYDQEGYPSEGKTYSKCPCYEELKSF